MGALLTDCGDDKFRCAETGVCVDLEYFCDGRVDCPDGEDEADECSRGEEMF